MELNSSEQLLPILRELQTYEHPLIQIRQYCKLSQKILQLPHIPLFDLQNNHPQLYNFIIHPNINYNLHQSHSQDKSKQQTQMQDAGKRIINMFTTSWDYYFRMIKGYVNLNGNPSQLYNQHTLEQARLQIADMLKEMEDSKYHWQNFTNQGLANMETEKKELKEEENFISLLSNMLKNQSDKVLRARNKNVAKSSSVEAEVQRQVVEEVLVQKQKKKITEVINIQGYFQQRMKQLKVKQDKNDPIAQAEKKRQFNASVLRYHVTTQN